MAAALEETPELRAEYDLLRSIKTQLPRAQFHPAPAVISNILQYSTKTTLTNEGVV